MKGKFIIRVYGLAINKKDEVLLTDEFQLGIKMTKFPGGGLEYGEGLIDGLKREFREECNGQEITEIRHFYTTDFYQKAQFFENTQLLSIYYFVELKNPVQFKISELPFDFKENINGNQSFRWVKIKTLNVDDFTFPIDKFVAGKLKQLFTNSITE
jgi:ADP-ribose pyrophosphatase YjhB (NUDIX family)